jgi:hypothetical protein
MAIEIVNFPVKNGDVPLPEGNLHDHSQESKPPTQTTSYTDGCEIQIAS